MGSTLHFHSAFLALMPSPMPPHFGAVPGKREIRDLIVFLAGGD